MSNHKGEIIIAEYDPTWPQEFKALSEVVGRAMGALALRLEHVGSTSVPGLAAKPILDVDVVIESWQTLPETIEALEGLGYRHQGDRGIPQREAFEQVEPEVPVEGSGRRWMDHHLYVCAEGTRELRRHCLFRDTLRHNPTLRRAYEAHKRQLAVALQGQRQVYAEAKSGFIAQALADAGWRE